MSETRTEGQAPPGEPDHAANGKGAEAASHLFRADQRQDAPASAGPPSSQGDAVGSSDAPLEPEAGLLLRESTNEPMGDAPGPPEHRQVTLYLSSLGTLIERTDNGEGPPEAPALSPDMPYARVVEQALVIKGFMPLWTAEVRQDLEAWLGAPLIYTLEKQPFRKWPSALPFLSTGSNPAARINARCAQLQMAHWYLHDDLKDAKLIRYGQPTAYAIYGPEACWASWAAALKVGEIGAKALGNDPDRIDFWQESLAALHRAQMDRLHGDGPISFQAYLQQSRERASFIGEWRERTARAAGETALAEFIARINPECATVGQVRNDLRNAQPREQVLGGEIFSDFKEGKKTAVTFLALNRFFPTLDDLWLPETTKLLPLLVHPENQGPIIDALDDAHTFLLGFITYIEDDIKTSELTEDVKTLWLGWVYRQFRTGVTHSHDDINPEASAKFLQAVENLSR